MKKLPYYKQQTPFMCSLACLRMVLSYFDRNFTEYELSRVVSFRLEQGYSMLMMKEICEIINFGYEIIRFGKFEDLKNSLSSGFYPIVIVEVKTLYKISRLEHGHYIVIKNIKEKSIIFNDPDIEFGGENKIVNLNLFLQAWERAKGWALIIKGERK